MNATITGKCNEPNITKTHIALPPSQLRAHFNLIFYHICTLFGSYKLLFKRFYWGPLLTLFYSNGMDKEGAGALS